MHPFFQKGFGTDPPWSRAANKVRPASSRPRVSPSRQTSTEPDSARPFLLTNDPPQHTDVGNDDEQGAASTTPKSQDETAGDVQSFMTEPFPENAYISDRNGSELVANLNTDRRKRRKITPSTSNHVSPDGGDNEWLRQLEKAAAHVEGEALTPISLEGTPVGTPQKRPNSPRAEMSSANANPQTTPRSSQRRIPKPVRGPDTPSKSQEESRSVEAGCGRTGASLEPQKSPTKKKILKLNRNGKLLSSPIAHPTPAYDTLKAKRVVIKYGADQGSRFRTGRRIDGILDAPTTKSTNQITSKQVAFKPTHPFFLGRFAPKSGNGDGLSLGENSTTGQESERQSTPGPLEHKPIPWKDIVFSSNRPAFIKASELVEAPWPPLDIHHLVAPRLISEADNRRPEVAAASKSKQRAILVEAEEDLLNTLSRKFSSLPALPASNLHLPTKEVLSGAQALQQMKNSMPTSEIPSENDLSRHSALLHVEGLLSSPKAHHELHRGESNSWITKYAPCSAEAVLQPEAVKLRDWMRQLTTSTLQRSANSALSKKAKSKCKLTPRKKKRRKIQGELDDFIVSSEEDDESDGPHVKNAILISGPKGCGKTASVFAVAKELGFEIFEIHPGMRRSAKDIFDNVGDMAQNHLVQGVANNVLTEDPTLSDVAIRVEIASGSQGTMNAFFKPERGKTKHRRSPRKNEVQPQRKQAKKQKQSLILFEEVDVLFEEDRGFWAGVLAIIAQSKRPVVLTCNDENSIPFDELPLYTTLRYHVPPADIVAHYLLTIAANEGHILDPNLVSGLYRSRQYDLRATITELSFWCQIGIGSQKGGLDWLLDPVISRGEPHGAAPLRVFSSQTYFPELGHAPPTDERNFPPPSEEYLNFARDFLDIPIVDWQDSERAFLALNEHRENNQGGVSKLQAVQQLVDFCDARSVLDLFDDATQASYTTMIDSAFCATKRPLKASDLADAYFNRATENSFTSAHLLDALDGLKAEKPTFPPSTGRLAPSLDLPSTALAVDIAPYVRSIVAFDRRLEQQRALMVGELRGKRARMTRASMAAVEGGSKASTRPEKWFPADTDFAKVMKTGGNDWIDLVRVQ